VDPILDKKVIEEILSTGADNETSPESGTFSGIPPIDKSKMWDYSLSEDGSGKKVLSFLVDGRTINFRLGELLKDGSATMSRKPDSESADFGLGGGQVKGRAQIHKANGKSIHGTFQTGEKAMPFLIEEDDKGDWKISPRKDMAETVAKFIHRISKGPQKVANFVEDAKGKVQEAVSEVAGAVGSGIDKIKNTRISIDPMDLTYPLTGPAEKAIPISAGIGASAGILKNLVGKITGSDTESSMWGDALKWGGGAGILSGIAHLMGARPNNPNSTAKDRAMYAHNMHPYMIGPGPLLDRSYSGIWGQVKQQAGIRQKSKDFLDVLDRDDKRRNAPWWKSLFGLFGGGEKKASYGMSGNSAVDLIAIKSLVAADPTLKPADRQILVSQAQRALMTSQAQGGISVSQIQSMGLGALAGYISAKILGFGPVGSIAAAAITGLLSSGQRKTGPTLMPGGYYLY